LIYSLVAGEDDADNTKFIVDGSTLRSIANLDFESKSRFMIRVRATDQGGLFTEESFTIHLTNVNEELNRSWFAAKHQALNIVFTWKQRILQ